MTLTPCRKCGLNWEHIIHDPNSADILTKEQWIELADELTPYPYAYKELPDHCDYDPLEYTELSDEQIHTIDIGYAHAYNIMQQAKAINTPHQLKGAS
jgi:hypothetical protein